MEPLTAPLTSAFALLLTALGHGAGWPVVAGGSAAITQGMANELRRLGGVVHTDSRGRVTGRAPAGARRAARHLAAGVRRAGRRAAVAPGRTALGALQARRRDLQGGLGARRAGALERRGLPAHRDGARRGDVRRGGAGGGGRAGRAARRAALRAGGPAVRGRPDAGAGGEADAVGLLPRAQRFVGGHDRAHGGADRAFRPGLPRPGAGPDGAHRRPRRRRTTPTCWGATSTAERPRCARRSSGRWRGGIPTGRRSMVCISARPRRLRGAVCTGCAAWPRPRWRCGSASPSAERQVSGSGLAVDVRGSPQATMVTMPSAVRRWSRYQASISSATQHWNSPWATT